MRRPAPRWLLGVLWLWPLLVAAGDGGRIALTVDDLPWTGLHGDPARPPPADLADQHAALIAALRARPLPVTGFVNEGKLGVDGRVDPTRRRMLVDWLDAGAELGNHTYGHLDLHAVGLEAWLADVLRGEAQLRPLLAERGTTPRWFRHPYLRAGRSAADKQAAADFLASHGYRIAPVTVDNSDWIWARAYRRALDAGERGEAERARLRADYLPYLLAKLAYYDAQARTLLGRAIPQVLLLHANELNAVSWVALIDALSAAGWSVIGLDEAMQDPAYRRADGYYGAYGPSWIHRWAMAESRPPAFFAGEPATPRWVLDLAGVDSE